MREISRFIFMLAFWILLSGHVDMRAGGDRYLLACGLISCTFVTYAAKRKNILDVEGHPSHLTVAVLAYLPWLFWEILLANLDVAYRVWNLRPSITPRLIRVPFRMRTSFGTVAYANSITLTPGTITVDVDEKQGEMIVHALSEESAQSLLEGAMHRRIRRLEGKETL